MGRRRRREGHYVLECERRATGLGWALRIQVERYDGARMGWEEIHTVFAERYPDRWAVQAFPPPGEVFNGAHKYHLFVLDQRPDELDLGAPTTLERRRGSQRSRRSVGRVNETPEREHVAQVVSARVT